MKTVALGKVAKIDRTVANDDECLSLPYVGLEHVEKERGHFADGFVPTPLNMLATNFRFTPKHVLYGKLRPYLNKVVLPNFDGVCTTEILPILPNEDKLDRTFLWAILLSPTFVDWATSQISGANLPRLDPKLLAEYEIPLPALTEQKRIASLLAQADRLRTLRRTAHELGESLLQSVFLEMFGNIAINERNLPKNSMEELCSRVTVGYVGSTSEFYTDKDNGIPFLRTQNVRPIQINRDAIQYVTHEFHKKNKKTQIYKDDVLVSRVGVNRGMAAVVPADFDGANCANVLISSPGKNLNPIFLAYLINSPFGQEQLLGISVGSAQGVINTNSLRDWSVAVPPLNLQEEFAGVVATEESSV